MESWGSIMPTPAIDAYLADRELFAPEIEIRKAIADRAAKPESLTEDDLHDWHILELVFRSRSETDGSLTIRGRKVEKRSEEHTSELQSLMRISYAVFCLKKKTNKTTHN